MAKKEETQPIEKTPIQDTPIGESFEEEQEDSIIELVIQMSDVEYRATQLQYLKIINEKLDALLKK